MFQRIDDIEKYLSEFDIFEFIKKITVVPYFDNRYYYKRHDHCHRTCMQLSFSADISDKGLDSYFKFQENEFFRISLEKYEEDILGSFGFSDYDKDKGYVNAEIAQGEVRANILKHYNKKRHKRCLELVNIITEIELNEFDDSNKYGSRKLYRIQEVLNEIKTIVFQVDQEKNIDYYTIWKKNKLIKISENLYRLLRVIRYPKSITYFYLENNNIIPFELDSVPSNYDATISSIIEVSRQGAVIKLDKNEITFLDKEYDPIYYWKKTDRRIVTDFFEILQKSYTKQDLFNFSNTTNIILNFKDIKKLAPCTLVPIVGIANNHNKFTFEFYYLNDLLRKTNIQNPLIPTENKKDVLVGSLNKIWKIRSTEDIIFLVDALINEISAIVVCAKGVLTSLRWILFGLLDNKSEISEIYVMGEVDLKTKHLNFCIYDKKEELKTTHDPQLLNITNYNWTRDKFLLSKLDKIVSTLNIISGSYIHKNSDNQYNIYRRTGDCIYIKGAIFDFCLAYDKEIPLSTIFNTKEKWFVKKSHDNHRVEKIILREKKIGIGTEKMGIKLSQEILDIYNSSEEVVHFEIDFSDIEIISFPFTNKLIGNLVKEFGFSYFNKIFTLTNMNENIISMINYVIKPCSS